MKTGSQIESEVCALFLKSTIPPMLSGEVYYEGDRPKDSGLEDTVIKFVDGTTTDRWDEGCVVIKIFVPDIDSHGNGQLGRDKDRCEEIEEALAAWYHYISKRPNAVGYRFHLAQIIHTQQEAKINQHFVTTRLAFKRLNKRFSNT